MKNIAISITTLFVIACSAYAGQPSFNNKTASSPLTATAARLLTETVQPHHPGMAVLVARGDELLYRGARGRASLAFDVALDADHVFRIASVTKQFAAVGLLRLIDEGRAALDEPLARYLPDYPGADRITLHQLLNHTSGIQSYTSIPGYMSGNAIRQQLTTAELIDVFRDLPAEFAPGEGWSYNNSGYVLVGAVIESITGQAWHAWLEQTMLRPSGLLNTIYGDEQLIVTGQADAYSVSGQGEVSRAVPGSMSQPHAAGALLSTVDDLWRWNRALHGGQLLTEASYRQMITPTGAAASAPLQYGYGIITGTVRGRPALFHSGGIFGFQTMLMYLPQEEITVAVLRNADGAGGNPVLLAQRLAAHALGDPYPEPTPLQLSAEELVTIAGSYQSAAGTLTLTWDGSKLTSQVNNGSVFDVMSLGKDSFGFASSLTRFELQRDDQGAVNAVRYIPQGEGAGMLWLRANH